MNILLFLTPKSEVAFLDEDATIRQALEKMEHHRYSAVPVISKEGKYVGTLTEGDLLWTIKNEYNLNLKQANNMKLNTVKRNRDNNPVRCTALMDDLLNMATTQNFVPIIDDEDIFIGIITRKDILKYFTTKYFKNQNRLV